MLVYGTWLIGREIVNLGEGDVHMCVWMRGRR